LKEYIDERRHLKQIEKNKVIVCGHNFRDKNERDLRGPEVHTVKKEEHQRECLKCEKKFLSSWIGNRCCPKCSDSIEYKNLSD
jgi:hypothetical protein